MFGGLDASHGCALLVTGVGAALLGSCFAMCYRRASATTVIIAGNVNRVVCAIAGGAIFPGKSLTVEQALGMAVCLSGATSYSLVGARQRDGREKRAKGS